MRWRSCRLPELIGPKVPGRVTEHPPHSEIRSSRHDPAPGTSCEGRKPCAQTISRVEGKDEVTTTRTASEWRDEWWLLRSREGQLSLAAHRVAGGSRPPPAPTERSVRISRTTLVGRLLCKEKNRQS
jgi:hypothetical protein